METVKGVNDQTFTVTVTPPGESSDPGEPLNAYGAIIGFIASLTRSMSKKWRITVSVDGKPPFHREGADDEATAVARAAEISHGIRTQSWHPWRD